MVSILDILSGAVPLMLDVRQTGGSPHRGEAIQAEGCPERFDLKFLWWVWRYPIDSRPRLNQAIDRFRERLNVVELDSTSAARTFLDQVS